MPKFLVTLLIGIAVSSHPAHILAQEAAQRSFSGERVQLNLTAGTYYVTASPDGRIRVVPRTKKDQVSVRLDVNTFGTRADLRVQGPKDGFEANIELPEQVNLVVSLTAGVLRISGIRGNKDISADAGEIEIAIGDLARYRHVLASVRKGTLDAPMLPNSHPNRQSLEWTGSGEHELTVKLGSGRITLSN